MAVEHESGSSSLIDVLDRILDKGIVLDAWARVSPGGIDLAASKARVVVASRATRLNFSSAVGSVERAPQSGFAESARPAKSVKGSPQRGKQSAGFRRQRGHG